MEKLKRQEYILNTRARLLDLITLLQHQPNQSYGDYARLAELGSLLRGGAFGSAFTDCKTMQLIKEETGRYVLSELGATLARHPEDHHIWMKAAQKVPLFQKLLPYASNLPREDPNLLAEKLLDYLMLKYKLSHADYGRVVRRFITLNYGFNDEQLKDRFDIKNRDLKKSNIDNDPLNSIADEISHINNTLLPLLRKYRKEELIKILNSLPEFPKR